VLWRTGEPGKNWSKRGDDKRRHIPVDTFVGVPTGTEGELDEEVNGKKPAAADEDQG